MTHLLLHSHPMLRARDASRIDTSRSRDGQRQLKPDLMSSPLFTLRPDTIFQVALQGSILAVIHGRACD